MAQLKLDIRDMAKVVERVRIDRAGSHRLDEEIVEAVIGYMQKREMERRQKEAEDRGKPKLIVPAKYPN